MVLVDFNHLAMRVLFTSIQLAKPKKVKGKYITDDFKNIFVHQIINNIQYFIKDFRDFGEVVICLEGSSWRKDFYPLYKANRSSYREDSDVNFEEVYSILNEISDSLKSYFGIKVISYSKAEGDDIIAVLAKISSENKKKTVIISSDKDFKQLLRYPFVSIYDPLKREYRARPNSIEEIDTELEEHIIKGDAIDNIPSIVDETEFSNEFIEYLKNNNVFVSKPEEFFKLEVSKKLLEDYDIYEIYKSGKNKGKKKESKNIYKSITKTKKTLDKIKEELNNEDSIYSRNYKRNKTLIDLGSIPEDIQEGILETYRETKIQRPNLTKIMEFCAKYSLKQVMANQSVFLLNKQEELTEDW